MGSVGDAYDNARAESFFATFECELLNRRRFQDPGRSPHCGEGASTIRVGVAHRWGICHPFAFERVGDGRNMLPLP
jgi:hypothetical protein